MYMNNWKRRGRVNREPREIREPISPKRSKRRAKAGGTIHRSRAIEGGVGKGGWMAGKRTGFSHVFQEVSMQVVDFPHLAMARLFRGRPEMVLATDGTRIKHGCRNDGFIRKAGKQETARRVDHGWTPILKRPGTKGDGAHGVRALP